MSSPFLSSGSSAEIQEILTSGRYAVNFSSITAQNLIPNLTVASSGVKEIITRQVQLSDLAFSVITNPYIGTLEATDFKTGSYASFNTAIGNLNTKTQNMTATVGDTDFGATIISNVNILNTNIATTGRVNLIQQASMGAPIAGRDILWSQSSDGRLYTTNSAGVANRIAYTADAPGGGGSTITNGVGESVVVNPNGSILYDGGCIEYVAVATGSGVYTALPGQKNVIVDLVAITEVSLPVSPIGTVYYVRREYALQGGEVWPASVFGVSAVGSTIEGLALFNISAFAGARFLFIGTKWVVC
jgi:hypothetical protein